ncbi:hypothetical protein Fcan01_22407 [Folsomia candida]|uniref:Uncharacterized protein n=1 Tax=Folsomia candida TaxID=158441 RepID=A0A226DD14_FOLCA|nr:hypothetical protein Fcan01_22407 [Folsomia candida]
MVVIGLILANNLSFGYVAAIMLSMLLYISTIFDRPITVPRKLGDNTHFRIIFGIWMLLLLILTNGYLGLSIKSITANLEAKSVSRFDQLTKPGCSLGNVKCYLDRLAGVGGYNTAVGKHRDVVMARKSSTPYSLLILQVLGSPTDSNVTLAMLANLSIRKFDDSQDFTLLSHSLDLDISKESGNSFLDDLKDHNADVFGFIRQKIVMHGALSESVREEVLMLDLLDPVHLGHYHLDGLASSKIRINNEVDVEQSLISCARTVLVQSDSRITRELAYFEKWYPWIKFFRSSKSILRREIGWGFPRNGESIAYPIFRYLQEAGIVQLLENWQPLVDSRRENVTRVVQSGLKIKGKPAVVKKVSLAGNIQIIFWLYLILNTVTILTMLKYEFGVQVRFYNYFKGMMRCIWKFWKDKRSNTMIGTLDYPKS